MNTWKELNA